MMDDDLDGMEDVDGFDEEGDDGLADFAEFFDEKTLDSMIHDAVECLALDPFKRENVWTHGHRKGLRDVARLLCDWDPELGIEYGLIPAAARPAIEDWDVTRSLMALKVIITIIDSGRLEDVLTLVNRAKDEMVRTHDDLHWDSAEAAIGAIEWGDFLHWPPTRST